ncbi:asparaginase [Dermabacteraceae bacterium P13264]
MPRLQLETPAARVSVLSLGGTIFMEHVAGEKAAPSQRADLVGTSLVEGIAVEHRAIANVGSPSIRRAMLRDALAAAEEAIAGGAKGVVVTHGTDTLEETAFLLNRYWRREEPLIVTGAMRPANAAGADGPANLRDAVFAAASDDARGLGVMVCFDGALHLADRVTKNHSRSVDAFVSEPSGPVGLVAHEGIKFLYEPPTEPWRPSGGEIGQEHTVFQVALGLFDDGEVLDALSPQTLDGLVIIGSGMGHVAAPAVARIRRLTDAGVPVVVATRVPQGGTSSRHYDYPGSEVDLIANGAVMAGTLPPHKARLLLSALIEDGADANRITEVFARYSL